MTRGVLVAALFAISAGATESVKAPAPFLLRGKEVDEKYHVYTTRLAHAYETLKNYLKRDAPDLYRRLNPAAPKPVPYGYQILPRLTRDTPPNERHNTPRAVSMSYTWARTASFIDWQLPIVEELEEQLKALQTIAFKERRPVYERWVREYGEMENNQRLVDIHIQYNHFWQQAIANDPRHFERLTKLHDIVLTRQLVDDALGARNDAEFAQAVSQIRITGFKPQGTRAEIEPTLREMERQMAEVIHAENSNIRVPAYVQLSHPRPTVWEVRVPVYTDIEDERFLAQAKRAIEGLWSIEERANTYRMHVDFRRLPAARLYRGARPPRWGSHIDVRQHAERFPRGGAVLTTGTNSTFAIPGAYVALGSPPLSYNVLAHEFGHLLGFVDGYFRGFRDLGDQGYEVLEVVPDPTDIMCTPGAGLVQSYHYRALFRAREQGARAIKN